MINGDKMKTFKEFLDGENQTVTESKLSHSMLAIQMRSISNKVHNESDIGKKLDLIALGLTKMTDTKLLNTMFKRR